MCCQEKALTVTMAVLAMTSFSDDTTNSDSYICDASPKETKVSTDTVAVAVIFFITLCLSKYCFIIECVVK
jgi:hypothetical protein